MCRNRTWKTLLWLLAIAVTLLTVANQPALAQTFQQAAGVTYPPFLIVGQEDVPVFINTTNSSLLGGGATASITIRVNQFTHQVSCATIPLGVCSAAGGENPPVFNIVSASGAGATDCAGVNFTIAPTGNPGEYTFTPDSEVLLEIGQSCRVDFLVDVVNLPANDADGGTPGIQTVQTVAATGTVVAIDGSDQEPGVGANTGGTGQNVTTVATCDATLTKQVNCDGTNNFVESCATISGQDARWRYIIANTGELPVSCTLTDTNTFVLPGQVLSGPIVVAGNFTHTETDECNDLGMGWTEPNTATANCSCTHPATNEPIDLPPLTDNANVTCLDCRVQVDKQVDCGPGFVDVGYGDPGPQRCVALTDAPLNVQWLAQNTSDAGVVLNNCRLSDSNSTLGADFVGSVGASSTVDSFAGFCGGATAQEEHTDNDTNAATILCDCVVPANLTGGLPIARANGAADSDTAGFACAGVDIEKLCEAKDELGNNAVTIDVRNTGTAELVNCNVSDSYTPNLVQCAVPGPGTDQLTLAGPGSVPFGLPPDPDVTVQATGSIAGLTSETCNEAVVHCQAVDPGTGQTVALDVTDRGTDQCPVAAGDCTVIIDEDGIDNDMFTIQRAASRFGSGVTADYIVNDLAGPNVPGASPPHPAFLAVPTKVGNPALRWNNLVADAIPDLPGAYIVKLPGGQVKDEGWFQLPSELRHKDTGELLMTSAEFITNGDGGHPDGPENPPQPLLDKVLDVMPLGNQELIRLVGKTCMAIVYDSDISTNWDPRPGSGELKLPNGNLQGERYGRFTFKVLGVEVPGSVPESKSSTSLYDLWVRVLPDQIINAPTQFPVHTEPDTIEIMRARQIGDVVRVRAKSQVPCGSLPANLSASYMTVSIDGADAGVRPPGLVDPFVLEFPMACDSGDYVANVPAAGQDLRGRRLVIQTALGGAYGNIRIN